MTKEEIIDKEKERIKQILKRADDPGDLRLGFYLHFAALYETLGLPFDLDALAVEVEKVARAFEKAKSPEETEVEVERLALALLSLIQWAKESRNNLLLVI
jgi:hypothetical protein